MEINNYTSAASSTSSVRTLEELNSQSSNELDKNAFLSILVAQLTNQNPLEPSSDTEFIAQLAQYSILEQLQNLNSTMSANNAVDMVGKYVYIEDSTAGNESGVIFGKVDGVIKQDGIDYLLVGDKKYSASDVVGVLEADDSTAQSVLDSSNLIGKNITALITGDDGLETTVTGLVEKITIEDGVVYVMVNGEKVALSDITEISEAE
jgi:flagellar basal-body rod modification protein FlgD